MLLLAVPRTIGALVTSPTSATLSDIQDQKAVDAQALRAFITAQERSIAWSPSGRLWTDLGLAELLIAEGLPANDPSAATALQKATQSIKQGLALAPANPYAWARLAYAEALTAGWSPLALSALRMALVTAPYEPRLLWSRLRLAFIAWPHMPADDRDLVFQQIRFAWNRSRQDLMILAAELDQVELVRAALISRPTDAQIFEDMLRPQTP
jgi:hypothetical protein